MSSIRKIIVPGASGLLGKPVVNALAEAGFEVIALTREGSKATFPSNIHVKTTDFSSSSLEDVLSGQDAVVCCLAVEGMKHQIPLVKAAVKVGVKRFIPSKFGHAPGQNLIPEWEAYMASKEPATDLMKEEAARNPGFTWTAVATGSFADLLIVHHPDAIFALDLKNQAVKIRDSGTEPIAMTSLPDVVTAVVGIMQNPEETANRWVKTRSVVVSQNELVAEFEKQTGKTWTRTYVPTEETRKQAQKLRDEGDTWGSFVGFLTVISCADGGKGGFHVGEDNDNKLLGLKERPVAEFVEAALKKTPAL